MKTFAYAGLLCALLTLPSPRVQAETGAPDHRVAVRGDRFVRDGKPYQILSGSIHFQRIPRAYWRDRLRKARAMGLNTVTSYVFWNAIEAKRGTFDFSGRNDVAAFLRMAQQEGLDVILRPGPYVCAEWDAGGLPAWLFDAPMAAPAGGAIAIAGLVVIALGFLALRGNIQVAPHTKEGAHLVTSGIYRWLRHPIYSGIALCVAGLWLREPTLAAGISALVVIGFLGVKRRVEERFLMAAYADYGRYRERTVGFP